MRLNGLPRYGNVQPVAQAQAQPLVSQQIDLEALLRWTRDDSLFAPDGRVISWLNPAHPGYAYDESTALFARMYEWLGLHASAERCRLVLEDRIRKHRWLGLGEVAYAFDTALALPCLSDPEPVASRLTTWLSAGTSCAPVTRPGWWSQSMGPHLIKAAWLLAGAGQREIASAIAGDVVDQCWDHGRFRIHKDSAWSYTHNHCYALEGLVGLDRHPDVVDAGLDWLVQLQEPDGSLPAWSVGPLEVRRPADIIAQAVRLWAAVDARKFAQPIQLGLSRLAALQDPVSGGIEYVPGSGDLNSWVAVFTLQAAMWAASPPSSAELQWLL